MLGVSVFFCAFARSCAVLPVFAGFLGLLLLLGSLAGTWVREGR